MLHTISYVQFIEHNIYLGKGYIYVAELQFHMFNSLNTIFIYSKGYIYGRVTFHMLKTIFIYSSYIYVQSYNFIVQFIEHNIYLQ